MISIYGLEQIGITAQVVHCHDCGMLASSPEEPRDHGLYHVKVVDAGWRVIGDGDNDDEQQDAEAIGLNDGYYWLCPDCFHYLRDSLPVVGGGFCNNFLTYTGNT